MHRIIYLSTAAYPLEKEEINILLKNCSLFNAKNNVSGILLYIECNFIQVLEGEKNVIQDLFEKIKADKRHKGVISVINESIEQRQFGTWSMGFYSDNYENLKDLNEIEDLKKVLSSDNKNKAVSIFLKTFLQSHRKDIIQF